MKKSGIISGIAVAGLTLVNSFVLADMRSESSLTCSAAKSELTEYDHTTEELKALNPVAMLRTFMPSRDKIEDKIGDNCTAFGLGYDI